MQTSGISYNTIKVNGIYDLEKVLKMLDRVFRHKSVECTPVLHQPDGVGLQGGHLGSFEKLNGVTLRMERLNLGNSPTANIKGKGDVIHIWKRV
ncbi:hypothetical protein Tco_1248043 [Tanacetum coccineum]